MDLDILAGQIIEQNDMVYSHSCECMHSKQQIHVFIGNNTTLETTMNFNENVVKLEIY